MHIGNWVLFLIKGLSKPQGKLSDGTSVSRQRRHVKGVNDNWQLMFSSCHLVIMWLQKAKMKGVRWGKRSVWAFYLIGAWQGIPSSNLTLDVKGTPSGTLRGRDLTMMRSVTDSSLLRGRPRRSLRGLLFWNRHTFSYHRHCSSPFLLCLWRYDNYNHETGVEIHWGSWEKEMASTNHKPQLLFCLLKQTLLFTSKSQVFSVLRFRGKTKHFLRSKLKQGSILNPSTGG